MNTDKEGNIKLYYLLIINDAGVLEACSTCSTIYLLKRGYNRKSIGVTKDICKFQYDSEPAKAKPLSWNLHISMGCSPYMY